VTLEHTNVNMGVVGNDYRVGQRCAYLMLDLTEGGRGSNVLVGQAMNARRKMLD
jgi:hypothetical protein